MPTLNKCLGKAVGLPEAYKDRLLEGYKQHSLSMTPKEAAVRAINDLHGEVQTELGQMLAQLDLSFPESAVPTGETRSSRVEPEAITEPATPVTAPTSQPPVATVPPISQPTVTPAPSIPTELPPELQNIEDPTTPEPVVTGEIRYSFSKDRMAGTKDLQKEMARPGIDRQVVQNSIRMQGAIVADEIYNLLNRWENDPSSTRAERDAAKLLRRVVEQYGLRQGLPRLTPASATAAPAERVHGSNLILNQSDWYERKRKAIANALDGIREDVQSAMDNDSERYLQLGQAEALEGQADELLENYQEMLGHEATVAKAGGNEALATVLNTAAGRISEFRKGNTLALAGGLRNIIKEIPAGALVSAPTAVAWIKARQADKSKAPLFSDAVFTAITTPLPGRTVAPLDAYAPLHTQLATAKSIFDDATHSVAEIKRIKALLNPKTGRRLSMRDFVNEYAGIKAKHGKIIDALNMQSREIRKALRRLEANALALSVMDRLVTHPDYIGAMNEAAAELNAMSGGVRSIRAKEGTIIYYDPTIPTRDDTDSSDQVLIDLAPTPEAERQNKINRQRLMDNVRSWLNTPESRRDPLLRNAWEKELSALQTWQSTGIRPVLPGTTLFPGINIPSMATFFTNGLWIFRVVRKFLNTGRNIAREYGGAAMAEVSRIYEAWDNFEAFINSKAQLALERKIDLALDKAMRAHGYDTASPEDNDEYRHLIYEPLLSQDQNPPSDRLKVGDRVNGKEILQEDMDLALAQVAWKNPIYLFLQTSGSGLLANIETPLLQKEDERRLQPGRPADEPGRRRVALRRGMEWGLKSPYKNDDLGVRMAQKWHEAANQDRAGTPPNTPPGTPPVITARQYLLENDPEFFRMAMLWMMLETNPDFGINPYLKENKAVREQIIDESRAPSKSWSDTYGDVVTRFGELMANAIPGASAAGQSAEFAKRALDYVDFWITRYYENSQVEGREEAPAASKATVQVVGASPFTQVRGGMVAPSPFYRYSLADEGTRLQLKEMVNIAFRKQLIVAYGAAEAAYKRALEDALGKGRPGSAAQVVKSRFGVRFKRRADVRRGKQILTIGQLENALVETQRLRLDLERVNKERAEMTLDDAGVRTVRSIGNVMKMGVLASAGPGINNMVQAAVAGGIMAHNLGLGGQSHAIPTAFRNVARFIKQFAHVHNVPYLNDIVGRFLENLSDQEIAAAMVQGLGTPWDVNEEEAVKRLFPQTGGISSTDPEDRSPFYLVQDIPGMNQATSRVRQIWNHAVRLLPGEAENAANLIMVPEAKTHIGKLVPRIVNHVRAMANSGPGWERRLIDDLSLTTHQGMGMRSESALNYLRYLLRPLGGFEQLMVDFHNRTSAMTDEEAAKQPFLTPPQYVQVAHTMARDWNKRAPSSELYAFIGKGFEGLARSLAGTFLRTAAQAAGSSALSTGLVPGDTATVAVRMAAMAGVALMVLAIAMMGLEMKQEWVNEGLYNAGRTVRRPGDIETLPQLMSYTAALTSPWGTAIPAIIQQASGETAIRPIADFSQFNLPANVAAEANQMLISMAQTRDVTQAAGDFVQRFFPSTRIVTSRIGREGEADILAASRALRMAAPPGVEIRQGGRGGTIKTPLTPVIRSLSQAVATGDAAGIKDLFDRAVRIQLDNGFSEKEARLSVQKALAARSPVQRAFPRRLSEGEMARAISALRPDDRESVLAIQGRFDNLTRRAKTNRGRRRNRRSALRSSRRRGSLSRRTPSFAYV